MLYKKRQHDQAATHLQQFHMLLGELPDDAQGSDPELLDQAHMLSQALNLCVGAACERGPCSKKDV